MRSIFLSVALVGVLGLTASLSVRAAEPALLHVFVVQTADVPAYAHEIDTLRALYKKQGLAVTLEAYQVAYAGPIVNVVVVETGVANLAALGKMDEMTRTQPDLVAERKKIDGMQQKIIFDGVYDKVTP